ncbi:MAG TPA: GFA family protein, partial [Myxococcota bacterium]|nr:GFA family protein [Myxococcota bacterium]
MGERAIRGSCLCGGVRFELSGAVGPFELCHCSRCRKASGTAFAAMVGVRREDFRLLEGAELIERYEAPVRERPPPYRTAFCRRCGSPVPDPPPDADWFEVAAGTLDDDPQLRPDRHIYVERRAPWHAIADSLPQLDRAAVASLRSGGSRRG